MDEAVRAIIALHEGKDPGMEALDLKARVKILRLKVAAGYFGYRFMRLLEHVKDTELVLKIIASQEDDVNLLVMDASQYSFAKTQVRLASLLRAVEIFCWYKGIPEETFLWLCPGLPGRVWEAQVYLAQAKPDAHIAAWEERRMEKEYVGFVSTIKPEC